ncbi:hypothetical protein [Demequina muriae]|uniref:DJ-1/PfpI family protein n=1 Tax=Demequina muriae TaxID=3051664 RepID=A0ABT8GHY8_9MICO|nr:hypothetical protein [Demequina sp. EGI L300058]MDN4480556.1 hypothetical protein [Demequina sp. EGI L300058]
MPRRTFVGDGRTIASICRGPWLLADDVELRRCEEEGWTLLTSRNPGDLDAFSPAVVEAAR